VSKAQASFEFLALLAFFLIVITFFTGLLLAEYSSITIAGRQAGLNNFADLIGNQINKVILNGPGSSTKFYLPEKIFGKNYSIFLNASAQMLEISVDGEYASSNLFSKNITVIEWAFGRDQIIENIDERVVIK